MQLNLSLKNLDNSGKSGVVYAVKLYPAGATTNSQDGVTDIFGKCLPVLEEMVEQDMPLLVIFFSKLALCITFLTAPMESFPVIRYTAFLGNNKNRIEGLLYIF